MTTRNVTNTAFTSYPATGIELPSGRQLTQTYDLLYRRTQVIETSGGANIASWQFFGPSRVAEVTLGNGLICTWMNNARTNSSVQPAVPNPSWGDQSSDRLGYDGAGRPITKRYLAGGINSSSPYNYNDTSSVVGFTTEYDLASNKFYERALHAEERSSLYEPFSNGSPTGGYDSLNRLRQYQRGVLTSDDGFAGNGGGSVATPIALPGTDTQRTYDLDSLGNWRRTVYTPEGGSQQTEVRQHNGLNEITRIQTNAGTPTPFSYDGVPGASNGNLANDGTRKLTWDALNRLVQANRVSDNAIIGQYVYDSLNRRIRKTVSYGGLSGSVPNGTTDCIYSGWRCIEERNGSNATTLQYIWGIYLDELLQIYAYSDFGSQPLSSGAYYPLQDLLYRTTALTNSSGSIVEAYDTDAYGNTLIFSAPGTGGNWWADNAATAAYPACPFIFTGQRFDPETEIYYYKRRYFSTVTGQLISRDPPLTSPNLYSYSGCRPTVYTDPYGLDETARFDTGFDVMAILFRLLPTKGCINRMRPLFPPVRFTIGPVPAFVAGKVGVEGCVLICCRDGAKYLMFRGRAFVSITGAIGVSGGSVEPEGILLPTSAGQLVKGGGVSGAPFRGFERCENAFLEWRFDVTATAVLSVGWGIFSAGVKGTMPVGYCDKTGCRWDFDWSKLDGQVETGMGSAAYAGLSGELSSRISLTLPLRIM